MMTRATKAFLLVGVIALGLNGAVTAASIPVGNHSFETPDVGGFQDNSGIAAGAALPNMSDAWYYLGGFSAGGSPVGVEETAGNGAQTGGDGSQSGYVNVGAALGSATWAPSRQIPATRSQSASPVGSTASTAPRRATIALASVPAGTAGDTALANPANWLASQHIDFATLQSVGSMFKDYQASFSAGASGGAIGQQLVAVLMSDNNQGSNNPIGFDNVRVSVIPEPASALLVALSGLLALIAVRKR